MTRYHQFTLCFALTVSSCGRDHSSETTSQGGPTQGGDVQEFSPEPAAGKLFAESWTVAGSGTVRRADGSFQITLSSDPNFSPCKLSVHEGEKIVTAIVDSLNVGISTFTIGTDRAIEFETSTSKQTELLQASGKIRIVSVNGNSIDGNIRAYGDDNNIINGRFISNYCP